MHLAEMTHSLVQVPTVAEASTTVQFSRISKKYRKTENATIQND